MAAISSKSWLAAAGVIVDTIHTRSAITACVIDTLIYVCRWKAKSKLLFNIAREKIMWVLRKIESLITFITKQRNRKKDTFLNNYSLTTFLPSHNLIMTNNTYSETETHQNINKKEKTEKKGVKTTINKGKYLPVSQWSPLNPGRQLHE